MAQPPSLPLSNGSIAIVSAPVQQQLQGFEAEFQAALQQQLQAFQAALQQQLQGVQAAIILQLARSGVDSVARLRNRAVIEPAHELMPLADAATGNPLPVGNGANDFPPTRGALLGLTGARVAALGAALGVPLPPGAALPARRAALARHCGLRGV
jgi:hypothetical protein